MKRLAPSVLLSALAVVARADAPAARDFAHGFNVQPMAGRPVQELALPDRLYQGVTRSDLGDLRVFNAAGIVVPHALCAGAMPAPETTQLQALRVFTLQGGAPQAASAGARVEVQTPAGTDVRVIEPPGAATTGVIRSMMRGFIVDAGATRGSIRALQLSWTTDDGASEAHVRVEASEDLAAWRTIVPDATLLHVTADGSALDLNHIELPPQKYRYLRLMRDGSAVSIERVTAEVVEAATAVEPFWFSAVTAGGDAAQGFSFETGRLAPVQTARVQPPVANMALRVALDSRPRLDAPWLMRWSGDVSSVRAGDQAQSGATAAFGAVTDPYWRIRILAGAESLGGGRPELQLGYHPARLRFLAQGEAPFVLAYGSARVAPAESRRCDEFVAQVAPEQRDTMIGAAQYSVAPEAAAEADASAPVRAVGRADHRSRGARDDGACADAQGAEGVHVRPARHRC